MVRTRRANKSNRKRYNAVIRLGSEDSESEPDVTPDGDKDVDFEAEGAAEASDEEGNDGADGDGPADNEDLAEGWGSTGEHTPADSDDDSDESSSAKAPVRKGVRLPRRSHVHEVLEYPVREGPKRIYDGAMKHYPRAEQLYRLLYGPDPEHIQVFTSMLANWFDMQALPFAQIGGAGVMSSPWLAQDFEENSRLWSKEWHEKFRASRLQRIQKIRPDHIDMFKPKADQLVCFVGHIETQQQTRMSYGFGPSVTESGQLTIGTSNTAPSAMGWLLDTGGIPLAIGWAPSIGYKEQFIAVCSVPFYDQETKNASSPDGDPEEKKRGSVQIWSVPCHNTTDGSDAVLVQTLSFDWGRAKRLQWCPVPPADGSNIGQLAILAADGFVRVIDVPRVTSGRDHYEWVEVPIATLGVPGEYQVKTTCFTWVNINCICLGHSDGSISLWSIFPQRMLSRRAVHTTHILDIASGFPSRPFHVASTPVSGCTTLTDLNLPSAEMTCIPEPTVGWQLNLLDWNEHLQGFFLMHPSSAPQNTVVGWAHLKHFVQSRRVLTADSPPTCVASGKTHPFTLVGCVDGNLWAFNPMRVLFKNKKDNITKMQVLQHEFRPRHKVAAIAEDKTIRGAARIVQGFRPVFNNIPRPDIHALLEDYQKRQKSKGPVNLRNLNRRKRKRNGEWPGNENEGENGMTLATEAAVDKAVDKTKIVVHESRTRITMAAWNPNVEFGWWAAAAMGSGLVKIMDLGLAEDRTATGPATSPATGREGRRS